MENKSEGKRDGEIGRQRQFTVNSDQISVKSSLFKVAHTI